MRKKKLKQMCIKLQFFGLVMMISLLACNLNNSNQKSNTSKINSPDPYFELVNTYRFRFNDYENIGSANLSELDLKNYTEALKLYKNGDSQKAIKHFQKQTHSSSTTKLYIANCYLDMKDFPKAMLELKTISNEAIEDIKHHKDWYLMLCHLGLKNSDQAILLLNEIRINKAHLFNLKSIELLRMIGNQ